MGVIERNGRFGVRVHLGNAEYRWLGTYGSREEAEEAERTGQPLASRCEVCGVHGAVVHHINRDHADNRPDNLIRLCVGHHRRALNGTLIWQALEEIGRADTIEDAWRVAHAALRGTVPERRPA